MGISRREYARRRGVSESAVRKAILSGRVSVEDDGTIDEAQANAEWAAQTDPSKQRGFHAVAQAVETAAETARAQKAVPRAAVDTVTETFRAHVAQTGAADPGAGDVSFYKARMANEVLKAQTQKVRLAKMKGELVDRDRAIAMVYDMARRERDA